MILNDFNYILPKELIAQKPASKKGLSKLLICEKKKIVNFENLKSFIKKNDVLIINDTKVKPTVINAKLNGKSIKITLLENVNDYFWKSFIKPGRKAKIGDVIKLNNNFNLVVKEKKNAFVYLKVNKGIEAVNSYLKKYGSLPLPPYIKTSFSRKENEKNYQTVFAKKLGAVASPTAGLHFNEKLIESLKESHISIINITLHIGEGTFLPLKENKVKLNKLHKEKGFISKKSALEINNAINNGKTIVAVGTTVMRLLEACYNKYGEIRYFNEETDLFIYPGFKFNIVDKLLTNFHLPKSSLFILVSAFAGKNYMMKLYEFAIKKKLRFFSYGDAMLVKRNDF